MKHKKQHTNVLLSLSVATALALVLAACDNSQESADASSDATNTDAVTDVVDASVDYSKVITAGEVRDGVAFGDLIVGNPDAAITLIEYASLTCSHCANFHRDVYPLIKEEFIKTGKVKLVFRNYTRDRADLAVAMITRCAGPEKMFDLIGVYFDRQLQWARPGIDPLPEIVDIARRAGISRADVDACMNNAALQNDVIEMFKQGQSDGLTGTPFFILNGDSFSGERSFEEFTEMFEDNM